MQWLFFICFDCHFDGVWFTAAVVDVCLCCKGFVTIRNMRMRGEKKENQKEKRVKKRTMKRNKLSNG